MKKRRKIKHKMADYASETTPPWDLSKETRPNCGLCHSCGYPLETWGSDEYCHTCHATRRYRSHGFTLEQGGLDCPPCGCKEAPNSIDGIIPCDGHYAMSRGDYGKGFGSIDTP